MTTNSSGISEFETCGRCGSSMDEQSRRAQACGPDICSKCHLDPQFRTLPIMLGSDRWFKRVIDTLLRIIIAPSTCFKHVAEPVDHTNILKFLAWMRIPSWAFACGWIGTRTWWPIVSGASSAEMFTFPVPTIWESVLGVWLTEALSIWLLLLVPIGIPLLYFLGGIVAHITMAMTGGTSRSIGSSMRCFGLSSAPFILISGYLEMALRIGWIDQNLWLIGCIPGFLIAFYVMAIGLARSHDASRFRGFAVAVIPWIFLVLVVTSRNSLVWEDLPLLMYQDQLQSVPGIPQIP